jgi:hypothetical protein
MIATPGPFPLFPSSPNIHGSPFVGCSIGLSHHRTPVVGVCVLPFVSYPTIVPSDLGSLYSARLGGGAWINEQVRLPVGGGARPLNTLQECAVTTGCERLFEHLPRPPLLIETTRPTRTQGEPSGSYQWSELAPVPWSA